MDMSFADDTVQIAEMIDRALRRVSTCLPGKILSFSAGPPPRVTVQPAVPMQTNIDGISSTKDMPPIVNAPLCLPFCPTKGFAITLPVAAGDPCLIIFSQRSIDRWADFGGVQSPEGGVSCRHHHLTDAFVMLAPMPGSGAFSDWSTTNVEIRNADKTRLVSMGADSGVQVVSGTGSFTMDKDGNVVVTAAATVALGPATTIDERVFLQHKHSGVTTGSDESSGVV